MTFTDSRAFQKVEGESNTLRTSVFKGDKGGYYVSIDHPVISGFSKLDSDAVFTANREYLQSINRDFWAKLPELPEDGLKKTVAIKENLQPISKEDWIALIKLYSAFCQKAGNNRQELEVGGLLVCHKKTKQIRIVIPQQRVTKASVDWSILGQNLTTEKKIFFLDGTPVTYTQLKTEWDVLGVTHSHNTMFTSPSGTDDTCEVRDSKGILPTGLHILVGSFKEYSTFKNLEPKYEVYASIAHLGHRSRVEAWEGLVEEYTKEDWENNTFDDKVLQAITIPTYKVPSYNIPPKRKTYFTPVRTVQKYSGYPSYSGKAPQKGNYPKYTEFVNPSVPSYRDTQKGAQNLASDNIVTESAFDMLRTTLDFLYFAMQEDPAAIAEVVRDYFSELGETVNVNAIDKTILDSAMDDSSFPTDEEIAELVGDEPYRDPFHVKDNIAIE